MLRRASTKEKDVVFINNLIKDNYAKLLRLARLALPEEDMRVLDDIVHI